MCQFFLGASRGNFDLKRMKAARLSSLSERLFAVTARQSNCWRGGGGSEGGRWKFRSDAPTSASSHLGGRMRGGERIGNCRRGRNFFFAVAGWDDAASGSPSPRQVDLSGYFRTSKTYLFAIYLRKHKLVFKRLVTRRTSK